MLNWEYGNVSILKRPNFSLNRKAEVVTPPLLKISFLIRTFYYLSHLSRLVLCNFLCKFALRMIFIWVKRIEKKTPKGLIHITLLSMVSSYYFTQLLKTLILVEQLVLF